MIFILTLFVFATTLSFSFLAWDKKSDVPDVFSLKRKLDEKINYEKWSFERTHVKEPGGIVFFNGCLYVTDKESDTIVVLDSKGNFKTNSLESNLYLLEPTVIKTDGEFLYVIDSGYNQLKVLSREFNLIQSVNLPAVYRGMQYWDLEIIGERIYLTAKSATKEKMVIFELDEKEEFKEIGECFVGYLCNFNGELMAINSLEFFKGKDESGLQISGLQSGRNGIFKVSESGLKLEFEFVKGYTPLDFLFLDDYLYVFSRAFSSLDKYTLEGQYMETLLKFDKIEAFVQFESIENSILLTFPAEKAIYKIDLN